MSDSTKHSPDHLKNKIIPDEVAQGSSNVVKELLESSITAESMDIRRVKKGNNESIQVIGNNMSNTDVQKCFEHNTTSQISVKSIQGKSTLTEAKISRPLKIFSLQNDTALQIVFSNYGGGFVEGDHIKIDLSCNEETTTAITSQAHTRVYRSERGMPSRQEIHAKLGKGAFATFLCDPLVLHANSIFEQQQVWEAEDDSILLFTDWFEAGRLLNGERFAFEAYHSEFKVVYKDIPWVWDKFHIQPSLVDPNSPGVFLHHGCYANIFLVGKDHLPRVQQLETIMRQLGEKYFKTTATLVATEAEIIGSFAKINDRVSLIRCSAKNNEILQNLMKDLAKALEHKDLLGFYPGHNI